MMVFTLLDMMEANASMVPKATGLAPSGGVAKEMIQSGDVTVNGEKETRRGAKLRGGEVVSVQGSGREILVEAAAS